MQTQTIKSIERVICKGEGINPKDLQIRTRATKIKETRQIVMYFAIEKGVSLSGAGRYYNLDHATALHAKKVVKNLCFSDKNFKLKISYYSHLLAGKDKKHTAIMEAWRDSLLKDLEEYKNQLLSVAV